MLKPLFGASEALRQGGHFLQTLPLALGAAIQTDSSNLSQKVAEGAVRRVVRKGLSRSGT